MTITHKLSVEIERAEPIKQIDMKQHDTGRIVEVTLLKNGEYFPLDPITVGVDHVLVRIRRPDCEPIVLRADVVDGKIVVRLKSQALAAVGRATAECVLYNGEDEQIVSSFYFYIRVVKVTVPNSELIGKDEYDVIQELFGDLAKEEEKRQEVEAARVAAEEKRVEAENVRQAEEEARTLAEKARVQAEDARDLAEKAREAAEEKRVEAEEDRATEEAARVAAEDARIEAEALRVQAENERVKAEEARSEAESAREFAEAARKTAEDARDLAEKARADGEALRAHAESERATAENARAEEYNKRADAEEKRVEAEKAREDAEVLRASAEEARKTAEEARIEAENARIEEEKERAEEEEARKAAEKAREDAEALRVQAEEARKTAEDARIEAENARAEEYNKRAEAEALRVQAENERVKAEEARAEAESARAAAETAREDAETLRASSEKAREDSEAIRATAENARNTAEEARATEEAARVKAEEDRATAEALRAQAEAAREAAEALRVQAEETRDLAEKAREAAENARTEAEKTRVLAEEERAAAENARAEADANWEEAEEARVTAEASRVTAENDRKTAEDARVEAENARDQDEGSRSEAETIRAQAEAAREAAEAARVQAEYDRANSEGVNAEAEKARRAAEEERVKAEDARALAEATRAAEEEKRADAENFRVTAEKARKTAEEARADEEAARVKAEEDRATAEATRAAEEKKRADAEVLRVQAEETRKKNMPHIGEDGDWYLGDCNTGVHAQGEHGADGKDGTTFTPSVSDEGILSWTNDGQKENPSPVNIIGPQGRPGQDGGVGPAGKDGEKGADGTTFTPHVTTDGTISWTNDGQKENPDPVNFLEDVIVPIAKGGTGAETAAAAVHNLADPLTAETTLADDDTMIFNDQSAGAGKKITVANMKKVFGGDSGKLAGYISVDKTEVMLTGAAGTTATVKVSRVGTGAIVVKSLDGGVASARVDGDTITISSVGVGTTTISVSVEADETYASASCAISVSSFDFFEVLDDNTWAKIHEVSEKKLGDSVWSVGDVKAVKVKGTVGTLEVDATYYVPILGFNHNSELEGEGITFGGFKTSKLSGVDLCFSGINYGQPSTDGKKYFNMNHWGKSNYGGWAASDIRYDILGSTDVAPSDYGYAKQYGATGGDPTATCATQPVQDTLMAALEEELRAVMKPVTKYTDNAGGGSSSLYNITATNDYLFLLSEFEVFGARTYANSYEQNYQKQYVYFENGNPKIRYQDTNGEDAGWWLLRSPYSGNSYYTCSVKTNGYANYRDGNLVYGLGVVAFVV